MRFVYNCETLKTRVKLNLNFTRPHAIPTQIRRAECDALVCGDYRNVARMYPYVTRMYSCGVLVTIII